MYTKIISTDIYFPEKIQKNVNLEKMIKISDKSILSCTEIKRSFIAKDHQNNTKIKFHGVKYLIEINKINTNKIDLIIFVTASSSIHSFPSIFSIIQNMLHINNMAIFHVSFSYVFFTYVLNISEKFIKNRKLKYALVILFINFNPKNRYIDFIWR